MNSIRIVNEYGATADNRDNIHIERRAHGNETKRGEWVRLTTEPIQRGDVIDLLAALTAINPR